MADAVRKTGLPVLPILGLVIVVVAAISAILLTEAQRETSRWVSHTIKVQLGIARFEKELIRYESAYRGYLIRPAPALKDDMASARANALADLAALKRETADNPDQTRRVNEFDAPLKEKIEVGENWVRYRDTGQIEHALATIQTQRGRILTQIIETKARALTREEERLLVARQAYAQRLADLVISGLVFAILLVVAVAVGVLRDARKRIAEATAARDDAVSAREDMITQRDRREAAEAQVRQMQKMESIGQLTGGIAHDFNNMLAIIIGSLDMAVRRFSDSDRVRSCIDHAREGAERAAALTARLLAFSRQQPLAPVPVDPNRLVGGMSELLQRTLGEQIVVETVLAGGIWTTFVDPSQLENTILNLAVNARDAMHGQDAGKLTIETMNAHLDDNYARSRTEVEAGQYILICVSDTGTGMPADVVAKAFDPFFTTKGVGKGTGLGLSQVFGFVKQSGGHVAIYSEPGQGTTVKLYMPRHQGELVAGTQTAAREELPQGDEKELILVVEDDDQVRRMSMDALVELGYSVISAATPIDALKLLRETPAITLLFTDVMMPGMNGRRLADEAIKIWPAIKVIFTTGYTRNAVVHNGMLDAGVAFLPKPFTIGQLALKVRDVLDGGGKNRN